MFDPSCSPADAMHDLYVRELEDILYWTLQHPNSYEREKRKKR